MLEPLIEALQKIDDEIGHELRSIHNKLSEIHFTLKDNREFLEDIKFLLDEVLSHLDTVEEDKSFTPPDYVAQNKKHFGTEL